MCASSRYTRRYVLASSCCLSCIKSAVVAGHCWAHFCWALPTSSVPRSRHLRIATHSPPLSPPPPQVHLRLGMHVPPSLPSPRLRSTSDCAHTPPRLPSPPLRPASDSPRTSVSHPSPSTPPLPSLRSTSACPRTSRPPRSPICSSCLRRPMRAEMGSWTLTSSSKRHGKGALQQVAGQAIGGGSY